MLVLMQETLHKHSTLSAGTTGITAAAITKAQITSIKAGDTISFTLER